jgi:hypothetical protein
MYRWRRRSNLAAEDERLSGDKFRQKVSEQIAIGEQRVSSFRCRADSSHDIRVDGIGHAGGPFHVGLGPEVREFEKEFAAWLGGGHCAGVANGTDAGARRCVREVSRQATRSVAQPWQLVRQSGCRSGDREAARHLFIQLPVCR